MIVAAFRFTPHETRVLQYLEQRGPKHRNLMVPDLADPESRIGRGILNGSNSYIPALAAKWCKRLIAAGYVGERRDVRGFHRSYYVTEAGRRAVRT